MAPRRGPGDTPAERARREAARADKLAALQTRLAEQVAALRSGQDWKDWLTVAARFHSYSFRNTLLIATQRPDATQVAGYRAWQALGRQVRKGERGIQVLAPVLKRPDTAPGTEQGGGRRDVQDTRNPQDPPDTQDTQDLLDPIPGRRVAGFQVAHVWDVSQTDGDPLPDAPTGPRPLAGQAPDGLWDALAAQVAAAGYTVERGDCGDAYGWTRYADWVVRVRGDVDDAQAVKTLAHELGHVLLHDPAALHTGSTRDCAGGAEVEAESVAYLVCTAQGMDTDAYTFPYVTGRATGTDTATPERVVMAAGQRALAAAKGIVDRLDTTEEAVDERTADVLDRSTAATVTTAALRGRAEGAAARDEAAEAGPTAGPGQKTPAPRQRSRRASPGRRTPPRGSQPTQPATPPAAARR